MKRGSVCSLKSFSGVGTDFYDFCRVQFVCFLRVTCNVSYFKFNDEQFCKITFSTRRVTLARCHIFVTSVKLHFKFSQRRSIPVHLYFPGRGRNYNRVATHFFSCFSQINPFTGVSIGTSTYHKKIFNPLRHWKYLSLNEDFLKRKFLARSPQLIGKNRDCNIIGGRYRIAYRQVPKNLYLQTRDIIPLESRYRPT